MVIRRAATPIPSGAFMIATALATLSKLSSGSPIPMKTKFVSSSPRTSLRKSAWPVISDGVRFRWNPSSPLAQKAQVNLHPACVDRQTVRLFPDGMSTASTWNPSGSLKRNFCVPSAERKRPATSIRPMTKVRSSLSLNPFGTSVNSPNVVFPLW